MGATLEQCIEAFLGVDASTDRASVLRELQADIKRSIKNADWRGAARALRAAADPALDFTSAQSLARLLGKLREHHRASRAVCRLAILGSSTTDQLAPLIELFAFAADVPVEFYQAPYGTFRQEIYDPGSALYEFAPKLVFLATGWRDLGNVPRLDATRDEVHAAVERECEAWASLWSAAHGRLACQIIQNNFDAPALRALDNHEMRHPGSLGGYVARVNLAMSERAPAYVTIHDADHLSASAGRHSWGDPRYYHLAKFICAPEAQVDYAHSVASLIVAASGAAKKCLVLDLDNTLWGGVIGDDGLGGIQLGQGSPEGEAFLAFQHYVLALRHRGVILAVCSKNDEHNAREPFEKHPEMALKLGDISCFVANWNDKASNLRFIAQQLNIGLDSLVFVDDNPAERSIVRQLAPEVAVPEMPTDPAGYVRALERHRYFQTLSLEAEDFKRTDFYRANAERDALLQASPGDIHQFLASLDMTGRIEPISALTLERSTQLINKSNQFNLTSRRYSTAEVMARSTDPAWCTASVFLADRFGDNGLISVVMAQERDAALLIDTWLMSCRVLKRGVEQHVLNHLVERARERGLRTLRGVYIASAKNGMVTDHYETLGFRRIAAANDGCTHWELDLADGWQPLPTFIRELRHG
jgi:FkbH-like protein